MNKFTKEKKIVKEALDGLAAKGWKVIEVDNGGESCEKVASIKEALEEAFAADDAKIWLAKDGKVAGIYIVLGNDAEEIINDYSANDDFLCVIDAIVDKYMN